MSDWISVEDGLPDRSSPHETDRVLVWISHPHSPGPYCPYLVAYASTENSYPINIKWWCDAIKGDLILNTVTHWMKLPDPPEKT